MPISSILWGPTYENVLTFGYPLYDRLTDREEREGSEHKVGISGTEDSWITGRDYTLMCSAKFVPEGHVLSGLVSSPAVPGGGAVRTGWSAAVGYQDFLDYHRQGQPFRFAPDAAFPGFYLDGCYLVDPKSPGPGSIGEDLNRVVPLKIRNPTYDFSRGLRGLLWEYAPGRDITQPIAATFSRSTIGSRYAIDGSVPFDVVNALRDRHYSGGLGSLRTTLLEPVASNFLLQSQAWATAPWGNNVVTATNNAAVAPDGTTTATKLLPNNTGANGNPYATQGSITITSGEFVAVSCFLKANGYGATVVRCSDTTSTNGFQVSVDLVNGVFGTLANGFGAGVLSGKALVSLGNGWYRVMIWGQINAGVTAAQLFTYLYDTIAHANTQTPYTADGVSSILGWGAQVERNGTVNVLPPTSYYQTTTGGAARGTDVFAWPLPVPTVLPTWLYAKFIERGEAVGHTDGGGRVLAISSPSQNPRLILRPTGGKYSCIFIAPGGAGTQPVAVAAPNFGDIVELLGWYDAAGNVSLIQAINGVAAAAVTVASGVLPSGIWPSAYIGVGQEGSPIGTVNSHLNLLVAKAGIQGLGGRTVQDVLTAAAA